jgi:hypothetical protein
MLGISPLAIRVRLQRVVSRGAVTQAQATGMSVRPHAFMKGCSNKNLPVIRAQDYPFGNFTLCLPECVHAGSSYS